MLGVLCIGELDSLFICPSRSFLIINALIQGKRTTRVLCTREKCGSTNFKEANSNLCASVQVCVRARERERLLGNFGFEPDEDREDSHLLSYTRNECGCVGPRTCVLCFLARSFDRNFSRVNVDKIRHTMAFIKVCRTVIKNLGGNVSTVVVVSFGME